MSLAIYVYTKAEVISKRKENLNDRDFCHYETIEDETRS